MIDATIRQHIRLLIEGVMLNSVGILVLAIASIVGAAR